MRILLALDGSPSSIKARDLVASLPWPESTRIRLTTAYDVPTDWAGGEFGVQWLADADDAVRAQLEAELQQLAAPFNERGIATELAAVRGRTASAVLMDATSFGADLIVVGSRGHGPLTSMMLGSVSAEIVEHAPCSVLVARSDRVSRLVVASDGSASALVIPEILGSWGVLGGLPAQAVSVAPEESRTYELLAGIYTLGSLDFTENRKLLLEQHRAIADQMADRLRAEGMPASGLVKTGDPAHQIIAVAESGAADLIVTGSRGLHGLKRLVLGSVARNLVLHAPSSVLVIRSSLAAAAHQREEFATTTMG